jgi:hypothetical protein
VRSAVTAGDSSGFDNVIELESLPHTRARVAQFDAVQRRRRDIFVVRPTKEFFEPRRGDICRDKVIKVCHRIRKMSLLRSWEHCFFVPIYIDAGPTGLYLRYHNCSRAFRVGWATSLRICTYKNTLLY